MTGEVFACVGLPQNLKDLKDEVRVRHGGIESTLKVLACVSPPADGNTRHTAQKATGVRLPRISGDDWKLTENSASLHILSTEGRGVGLCWAHSQPKGPEGLLSNTNRMKVRPAHRLQEAGWEEAETCSAESDPCLKRLL